MTGAPVQWPGTTDEAARLMRAIDHNCGRTDGCNGVPAHWRCGAHSLLTDPYVVSHLVFAVSPKMAKRWKEGEWNA